MRVLLLGGTRFIGRAIAERARAAGHDLLLFNRGQTDAAQPPDVRGDVDELVQHRDALRALAPDAVVHCIAYTEQHGRDLAEVFEGLDVHAVVLGSMDCYRAFSDLRAGQEPAEGFPTQEADPLAPPFYWRGTEHGRAEDYDKNLLTDALLAAGAAGRLRPTVLRLPMVYGPEDPQFAHRHGEAIWHCLDERPRYVIGAVTQATIWTFGYVENVAAGVLHTLAHPAATAGQVYNLGEARVRTKRRWAELYAAAAGLELEVCAVPDAALGDTEPNAAAPHLIVDSGRFARETEFVAPVTVEQAVARTLDWARAHPDALGPRPDYAAREALLA